jgi:hypothetical protein
VNFAQPRFVAIKLSEGEYSKKYEVYCRSAAFKTDMKMLGLLVKTKNDEEIKGFRGKHISRNYSLLKIGSGWDMKDIHNFYLFDYCTRKKCAVLMGDIDQEKIEKKQIVCPLPKLKILRRSSNLEN